MKNKLQYMQKRSKHRLIWEEKEKKKNSVKNKLPDKDLLINKLPDSNKWKMKKKQELIIKLEKQNWKKSKCINKERKKEKN